MPKLIFTPKELEAYLSGDKNQWHCFYEKTVKYSDEMRVHSEGKYPCDLIDSRRPNEPFEVMEYRKAIFVAKTKPYFSKIVSSLSKIRRSSDWSIRYEHGAEDFPRIVEGQHLEDYCERNYPGFESVTNWAFSVLLKNYLVDPNAVIFVYPPVLPEGNEFLEPVPEIFDSCNVIDYVHADYCVLNRPEGCVYTNTKGATLAGKSIYIITTMQVLRYDQNGENFELVWQYDHNLGIIPAYKIGSIISETSGKNYLYESRVAGILPEFNEAIREYSDLQAAKVLHIFPERWEFSQHECASCKGTGKRRNPLWFEGCDASIPCDLPCDNKACYNGYTVAGPYSKIMLRPPSAMEGAANSLPVPPAGYVQKDIDIVKLQEEGIDRHIQNGLASINFEFLTMTPLNESGKAKEVDKDELNNTVHSIAEDIVRVMDWLYDITATYRYNQLYDEENIELMQPTIAVPEKFDILSSQHLEEQLQSVKAAKANPVIINQMEKEYANKAFNNDPSVSQMVELTLSLDPLANISEDDKMTRLSNRGITQTVYIISSNIHEFIARALVDNPDFAELERQEQVDILVGYAKEQEQVAEDLKVDIQDDETEIEIEEQENANV